MRSSFGLVPVLLPQPVEVLHELHDRVHLRHGPARVLRVGRRDGLVAPAEQLGVGLRRRPHHAGDHVHRERHRHVGREVERLAGGVGVEEVVEQQADLALEQGDLPRREALVDDLPVRGVLGRVEREEVLGRLVDLAPIGAGGHVGHASRRTPAGTRRPGRGRSRHRCSGRTTGCAGSGRGRRPRRSRARPTPSARRPRWTGGATRAPPAAVRRTTRRAHRRAPTGRGRGAGRARSRRRFCPVDPGHGGPVTDDLVTRRQRGEEVGLDRGLGAGAGAGGGHAREASSTAACCRGAAAARRPACRPGPGRRRSGRRGPRPSSSRARRSSSSGRTSSIDGRVQVGHGEPHRSRSGHWPRATPRRRGTGTAARSVR